MLRSSIICRVANIASILGVEAGTEKSKEAGAVPVLDTSAKTTRASSLGNKKETGSSSGSAVPPSPYAWINRLVEYQVENGPEVTTKLVKLQRSRAPDEDTLDEFVRVAPPVNETKEGALLPGERPKDQETLRRIREHFQSEAKATAEARMKANPVELPSPKQWYDAGVRWRDLEESIVRVDHCSDMNLDPPPKLRDAQELFNALPLLDFRNHKSLEPHRIGLYTPDILTMAEKHECFEPLTLALDTWRKDYATVGPTVGTDKELIKGLTQCKNEVARVVKLCLRLQSHELGDHWPYHRSRALAELCALDSPGILSEGQEQHRYTRFGGLRMPTTDHLVARSHFHNDLVLFHECRPPPRSSKPSDSRSVKDEYGAMCTILPNMLSALHRFHQSKMLGVPRSVYCVRMCGSKVALFQLQGEEKHVQSLCKRKSHQWLKDKNVGKKKLKLLSSVARPGWTEKDMKLSLDSPDAAPAGGLGLDLLIPEEREQLMHLMANLRFTLLKNARAERKLQQKENRGRAKMVARTQAVVEAKRLIENKNSVLSEIPVGVSNRSSKQLRKHLEHDRGRLKTVSVVERYE